MGYTLIIARAEDVCCRLVREYLISHGHRVIHLTEGEFFPGLDFAWELSNGNRRAVIRSGTQIAGIDEIDGVLARFSGIATSAEDFRSKDGQYLSSEYHALLRGYLHTLVCPVVNRPGPELWYRPLLRAPELASLVPALKFLLPRSTVTTSYEDACAFFDACDGSMCYSPLTLPSDYVITSEEKLRSLKQLSTVLPLYLSEVVAGETVSVYVIGDDVVVDGAPRPSVIAPSVELAKSLQLVFCQMNLVQGALGRWYCLSVNARPTLFECVDATRRTVVARLGELLCLRTRSSK